MALGSKQVLPGADPYRPPPPGREVRRYTPVSFALVAISVVVFVLGLGSPQLQNLGVLSGPLVKGGDWWRGVTFLFTHGGGLHLFFNMSAVWTVGRVLEAGLGSVRFFLISAVGAAGSAAFILLFNFDTNTVGMSGMILSWLGALLPIASKPARRDLVTWLVQIAVISLLPGVSWSGHLGGFLFGLPAGLALRHDARTGEAARGKTKTFSTVMPFAAFAAAVLAYLAGSGRLQ